MKGHGNKPKVCAKARIWLGKMLPALAFLAICFAHARSGITAFAEGSFSVGADAAGGINDLNNIFFTLIQGAGDILMVLGVWRFGVAFTSDNAHEISKGTSAMVCGAMLANIKTLMGG